MTHRRPMARLTTILSLVAAALLLAPIEVVGGEWGGIQTAPSESECRPYIEKALKELGTSDSQEETDVLSVEEPASPTETNEPTEQVERSNDQLDISIPESTEDAKSEEVLSREKRTIEETSDIGSTEENPVSEQSVSTEEREQGEATLSSSEEAAQQLVEESVETNVPTIEEPVAEETTSEQSTESLSTEQEVVEGELGQITEPEQPTDEVKIEESAPEPSEPTSGEALEEVTTQSEPSALAEERPLEQEPAKDAELNETINTSESEEIASEPVSSEETVTENVNKETNIVEEIITEAAEQILETIEEATTQTDESANSAEAPVATEEPIEPTASEEISETIVKQDVPEVVEESSDTVVAPEIDSDVKSVDSVESTPENDVKSEEEVAELAKSQEESAESLEKVEADSDEQKTGEISETVEKETQELGSTEVAKDSGETEKTDEKGTVTKIIQEEGTTKDDVALVAEETEVSAKLEEALIKANLSAEEVTPDEEDLTMILEIPEKLRPRDHIAEILRLDSESAETEMLLSKTIDMTLRDLKRLYETAIKPLEILYKYRDLSNRHFGDPEIFSKPLILFMGPWSGGKSTIINYLLDNEYKKTALRTGAEPSPAYFNIVMWGEREEVLDGTQLAADWTFSGLQKFGQGLLDRLRGLRLKHPLLEKVNVVEIPGILEIRKQVERLFPFNDACQWFIDRADIIFLVYDPSKLDVGPESEAILDQLKGREYQTRIILNKADQVKPEELMRVQGTLIWNISPLMSSTEPPVMYSTSLWSLPYESGAPTRLLYAQEKAFLRDLRDAVDKRVENKIASARRFAVRVRNHAKMVDCYLTTYYNHKTFFGNRQKVSDDIIEHPQNYHIYEGLSTLTNISRYDLPDPEVYKDFFRLNPVYDFQQLSATCTYFRGCPINRLDVAIAYELPELVGKYKKTAEEVLEAAKKFQNS